MATYDYSLPELGEGIGSGDVIQILVTVGDSVVKDQPVIELETDKAVIEVPAPVDGIIQTIHVQEGDKASVGQVILTLETRAVETAPAAPARGMVVDTAEKGGFEETAPAAELSSQTPLAREVEVERPGKATSPQAEPLEVSSAAAATSEAVTEPETSKSVVPAPPSVRRLAREIGVDITRVPGSGPGGRINAEDVKAYARQKISTSDGQRGVSMPVAEKLPDFTRWGDVERQPMTRVRQKTAATMAQAWSTIPHVTQFGKADITELESLRQQYAPRAEAVGGKLTITAIVLKILAEGLKQFPQFNASLDLERQEVVYKKYYHIGVAVDTGRGLLVPVIRDVDRKSLIELSVELTQTAEKARNKKVSIVDMQGATFTVTNLGGIGGTYFSPIINPPEVAILGLARSATEAVYSDGQFQPRLMLPLALSYDHRLIDGADGARFIRWLAEVLAHPFLMAFGGLRAHV